MRAIVNADRNWGIGFRNGLLVHIPSDMRFFREKTTDNVVVMGRKTLESLPGGRPLSDRDNIVLSRDAGLKVKGAAVVHSVEELEGLLSDMDPDRVYVIGGAEIYRLLLPLCDTVYVTRVDYVYQADAFFPDLDSMPEWELTEEGEEQTCFDMSFTFCTYKRVQK
ncbi:MAG: dihydrofolate reductase [Eubacterium sp.]|nr:dihydrofolate reductase [Eubacterium sp.]